MFYNIKMKLLIGGKSRNIYMRKDGSAYYKSGGQQVDITHMFKKNGGGLKKKYIKGGAGPEDSSFDANEEYDKVAPKTQTAAGAAGTETPAAAPGGEEATSEIPPPPSKTPQQVKTETNLAVSTNITALASFPCDNNFYSAFLDLAQLVISVTNSLKFQGAKIVIEPPNIDMDTSKKQVTTQITKLNAIINLFKESIYDRDKTNKHTGIFSDNDEFITNIDNYKKKYLRLYTQKDETDTKFILKKSRTQILTLDAIIRIVDIIGIVAGAADHSQQEYVVLKATICKNIKKFLELDDQLEEIVFELDI